MGVMFCCPLSFSHAVDLKPRWDVYVGFVRVILAILEDLTTPNMAARGAAGFKLSLLYVPIPLCSDSDLVGCV